ncbi:glycosyltransferase family 2 protein [Parasphingopyxis algicola]|uniref:glycosyltransferase family 2 protein n=1 Tax=Parasphingopyxis algicola TaxID=2026624 RepID=UPI00159FA797|nr:glycosyltransferase family A protein [Parasphingopyxis algicola]QLC23667.1 glycosyltransferase family 2 protein [Parasphingopyxis algicola]
MERLAASPFHSLRRWAARKAADRSMHWAALKAASDDPYVLARLGLYPLAMDYTARDAAARIGRDLAAGALGRADAEAQAALVSLPVPKRRLAARLLALQDPDAALALLPEADREAAAACLLALGRTDEAAFRLDKGPDISREAAAIWAHIATRTGDHEKARTALNAMFARDGLCRPLPDDARPFTIDDLGGTADAVAEGPKISVVIPYHNAAATLDTAVGSLTGQSWQNLEILLVDDRSTDDGPAIARRLAEADGRIVCLANERAPGVYGARNSAVAAATGDFVTFLDADDWSPVERIERQLRGLGSHALGIANHIRMDEAGRPVAPRIFPLVRPVPITMFLRRDMLIAAGPFEEVATGADSEMFARLEMLHGKAAVRRDPAVLLVARWRSGSLSREREGGLLGRERYAYRADWMFRHAGLEAPRLPGEPDAA